MIQITPALTIDEKEVTYDFIRAAGPGGQNVNKVATAVQLRFDLGRSPSLPPQVKERLLCLAGRRVSRDGILVIEARRYRTQEQNRLDAEGRLVALIRKALLKPKARRATRPSPASMARRVEGKKRRASIKKNRQEHTNWND